MKDKLIRVFQLLNVVNVSGQQNILALGESLNIIQNLVNDIIQKEQEKTNKENIPKNKEETK